MESCKNNLFITYKIVKDLRVEIYCNLARLQYMYKYFVQFLKFYCYRFMGRNLVIYQDYDLFKYFVLFLISFIKQYIFDIVTITSDRIQI